MTVRFAAADEPPQTRLDYWQHLLSSSLAPYQIRAPRDPLRADIQQGQLGPISVLRLRGSAMQANRTHDLISNSDLELCKIDVATRGQGVYEQHDRQSRLSAAGEFTLIDLSRPSRVVIEPWQEASVVIFPR